MDKQIITFTANEQCLRKTGGLEVFATKTVSYIEAHFDLGTNWSGYDSVRAVWWNDYVRPISTVLDTEGICIVPTEVLLRKGTVYVNLVGSIAENEVLTDRLTTIPITALVEKFNAHVDSTETAPITPSQFDQFVQTVKADADRAEDAKDDARGFASDAETSAENAHTSEVNASASEDNAKVSELNAEAYKNQAQTYAQNAYNSSVSAENAKDDAILARDEIRNMTAEATTLPEGSDATASYSGGVLSLGIPKGDKGDKGNTGETGATPQLSIGTVTTTTEPSVTITGTAENPVLNFGLVKGDKGDTGEVSQAQLDAAVSGLKSDLSAAYEYAENMTLYSGIYLTGATTIGASYTPTFHATVGYYFGIVEVTKGDLLVITGKGGNGARLWTLVNKNGDVVNVAGINVDVSNQIVHASEDGYVYISVSPNGTYTPSVVKYFGAGKRLNLLSESYYDWMEQDITKGKYYAFSDLTIGGTPTVTQTTNASLDCVAFDCSVGDKFRITGKGGTAGRLWVLTDQAGRVLNVATAEQEEMNKVISINTSGKLYISVRNTVAYKIEKMIALDERIIEYIDTNTVSIADYNIEYTGVINLTGYYQGENTIGSLFNPSFVWSRSWANAFYKVHKGDVFTITGTGGQNVRLYTITDSDGYVLKASSANAVLDGYILTIEEDGYLYCAFNASYDYDLSYTRRLQNCVAQLKTDVDTILDGAKVVSPSFLYNKDIPSSNYVVQSVMYDPTEYMSLEAIYEGYDALVTSYPNYVTKTLLGKDQSDTYNIYKYEFKPLIPTIQGTLEDGTNYTTDSYPVVILDACTHGSERPCAMALLNVMTKICNATEDNGLMGWMRSNIHFVVVPIVNPWGYVNYDRRNSRGVDLNRNYIPFWRLGESDSTSWWYRGASELSEVETQYVYNILDTYKDKAIFYYSYHTFGESAQGWEHLSCYFYGPLEERKLQTIGINLIDEITKSGWANHNLPTNSGYIGLLQNANVILNGNATQQGSALGIPSVCPEVLHRYYDGSSGSVYNTDLNTINAEWMIRSIALACKTFL